MFSGTETGSTSGGVKGLSSSSLDPASFEVPLVRSSSGSGSGSGIKPSNESFVPLECLCSGSSSLDGGVLCCTTVGFTGGTGTGANTGGCVGSGAGAVAGVGTVAEPGIGRLAGGDVV